jgi:DnaK suppressor protein
VDTATAARLAAERERTLVQIAALTSERSDIVAGRDLGSTDDEHDPEGATIAFEHARVGALLAQARAHLAAIDHAESRLRSDVLDRCEKCGELIGAGRREARPTATTCIACASRAT